MTEKGEVVDTVSLPPTYAPSEAYTESPPPAYKRAKSTTVQVARMVCITLLAVAFMIGFFTVTSNYLSAKHCDCHNTHHSHDNLHSASVLPQVEKLVGSEGLNKLDEMNGNGLESEGPILSKDILQEDLQEEPVPDAQEVMDDNIPEEEVEALVEEVAELEEAEREIEEQIGVQDIMQKEIDEMKKKIKLPIDLILGNPSLAGRDVNCEVERRQQPIGGGIVTQAIIVTCSDDDDKINRPGIVVSPQGPRPFGPPLSLLAPIMKMLSAKAKARMVKPIQIKTMAGQPPFAFPSGPRPFSPNGPIPNFMNQPKISNLMNQPKIVNLMNQPKISGPFPGPINGPFPMPGPINGPVNFNGPMPGPFSGPFPGQNGPFPGQNGPFPGPNGPFPVVNGPFPGPFPGPNPDQISRRIHLPVNGPTPNDIPGPFPVPFPGPSEGPSPPMPKILMQGPTITERITEEEPRHRMLPIALRPLPRVSPRMPKILAFATKPERQGPQTLISTLQRGANKVPQREPKILPTFPEPQARALPSPVTLPGLRLLPARLLSGPVFMRGIKRNDEPRPVTHMEMRKPEPSLKVPVFEPIARENFGPPRQDTLINSEKSVFNQLPLNAHPKIGELDPSKIVSKIIEINNRQIPTDIMSPPKPIAVIHKTQPIAGTQLPSFLPPPPPPPHVRIPPPPPPKMDPEGRVGDVDHVEPDAEFIIHSDTPPTPEPIHEIHEIHEVSTHQEIQERPPQSADKQKHHLLIVN